MNKKVLIIAYSFPPYPGIGGRRWAKFAKYLKKLNTDVFVIASENPFNEESHWTPDIKDVSVTRLPLKYPASLIKFPRSISGRINYKLSKFFVQSSTKGNYYDKTIFWKKQLLEAAKEIIEKKQIKNVIVTGAPYHLMHHSLTLKEWKSELNLIVDFRDFWTDNPPELLGDLSAKRLNEEKRLEQQVLEKADRVLTVSDHMSKILQAKILQKKVKTIINGFDEEDFGLKMAPAKNTDIILFVFTGTLYHHLTSVFVPFCNALQKFKKDEPQLYSKLRFEFYGSADQQNIDLIKQYSLEIVSFHKGLPLKQAIQKINDSDYCLLFLMDTYSFSLSTKFCEYIAARKPIVLFSERGNSSEFIEKNGFGFWINPTTVYEQLYELATTKKKKAYNPESEAVRSKFSISEITKDLYDSVLI